MNEEEKKKVFEENNIIDESVEEITDVEAPSDETQKNSDSNNVQDHPDIESENVQEASEPNQTHEPIPPIPAQFDRNSVPEEIKGWNWGAFAFNIFWGIGNKTYLPLLCLIPFFNIVWIFICGAKGNEWAWESGNYSSIEEFKLVQDSWKRAGLVQAIFMIVGFFFMIFFYVFLFVVLMFAGLSEYQTNSYGNDYYNEFNTDNEGTYDYDYKGSGNNTFDYFSNWTQETYDSIKLATEVINAETNVASYENGTSFKDLITVVGEPDNTYRTGNTILATWWSDSDNYIDISYDVTSGLITDKSIDY